ncbi:monocarboxylate transporter 6-like isoform X2 [Mercenaria mercenaria]|uniref:monocarboxylate transporter 6-like isoform X2 n=1 Tax=Mercenaria mercenaria TaxID=6596 RepID=UPI00234E9461|nr:monocarboxylate transporter 6-like isoform X2 [Mercenaria mercenaria]
MTKRDQKKETQPFNTDKERSIDTASENFSDLDTGWAWVVLFASFGTFCLLGGKMYAVGIIHSALLERYSKSVSLTSWAGALHTALFSLGGPLSSAVIDRFSCRTALMLSGVFFIAGYIGTAFADTIEMAIFTCGILAGFLVDVSGTYDQSIIVAASCILFSTISSAVTACFNQKSDDFLQKEETVAVVDNQIKEKQSME